MRLSVTVSVFVAVLCGSINNRADAATCSGQPCWTVKSVTFLGTVNGPPTPGSFAEKYLTSNFPNSGDVTTGQANDANGRCPGSGPCDFIHGLVLCSPFRLDTFWSL